VYRALVIHLPLRLRRAGQVTLSAPSFD